MALRPRPGNRPAGGGGGNRRPPPSGGGGNRPSGQRPAQRPAQQTRTGARPAQSGQRSAMRRPAANNQQRWNFRRRTEESVQRHISEGASSRFDGPIKSGFAIFKAKDGVNAVRILPATWTEGDDDHYAYKIWLHRFVGADSGTYPCLRKMKNQACACCDAAQDERRRGDPEVAKSMMASENRIAWIINRAADDPTIPEAWIMSSWMDQEVVSPTRDPITGSTIFPEDIEQGYDLTFQRKKLGKDPKNVKYMGYQYRRDASPALDRQDDLDKVMEFINENPIPNIIKYYSNEYLEQAMSGTAAAEDEDLDGQEAEGEYAGDEVEGEYAEEAEAEAPAPRQTSRRPIRGRQPEPEPEHEGGDEYTGDETGEDVEGEEAADGDVEGTEGEAYGDEPGDERDYAAEAENEAEEASEYADGEEPADEGEEPDVQEETQPARRPIRARPQTNGGGQRQPARAQQRRAPPQRTAPRGGNRPSGSGRYRD